MKIVVAHAADETVDPPRGRRAARKTDVQEVAHVLRAAGHEVGGIAIDGTPDCLRALMQLRPDLIFNLVESFGDDNSKEPHVAAYYEMLGLPYTGSGHRGLTLAMDKAVAKKILGFHNVVSPKFAVFWRGRLDWDADDVEFPVIVKPLREDGSIGIGFDALAGNIKELMERIDALSRTGCSPSPRSASPPSSTAPSSSSSTWRGARSTWASSGTRRRRPCRPSSWTSPICRKARRGSRAPR